MSEGNQLELFQVKAFDPPLRDSRDVMEYPFLSIQKGRRKAISFTSADRRVSLLITAPEEYGIATIWDWDLIIYLVAHLNDALESGFAVTRWIEFPPYDALRYMRRGTGGKDYRELVGTIRRLSATHVMTNIRQSDTTGSEGNLRWIENYRIPKKYRKNQFLQSPQDDGEADPAQPWAVLLPEWIFAAVLRRREVLAVHPDYFDLTGGLERWLYRLARKAVPDKGSGSINFRMDTLHKRSGSTRPLRNFAGDIRDIADRQPLPEYGVYVHQDARHELVTLFRDLSKPRRMPRGVRLLTA